MPYIEYPTTAQKTAQLLQMAALAANELGLKGKRITKTYINFSPKTNDPEDSFETVDPEVSFETVNNAVEKANDLQDQIDRLQREKDAVLKRIADSATIEGRIFKVS